nr:capsid protein [Porcine astrovirus 2]
MASRQRKSQPRNTTNIVVRNGAAANQAGPSRANQARRRRNRRKPQQTVVRVLSNKNQGRRRNTRSPGFGNRVVVQKIVTTLGTVGSNGSGSIETELAILLNPCTMKETTASNTYGPVQIYASTYSLFSITISEITLKPLVGGSAVSGTVVRASWNPTNNPSQMSWSALGARKHSDTTPGREGRFSLSAKDLKGPKDGWYKTNPKGEPMLSFAGSLEVHTLGETRSTYQNGKFTGGLFLAELEVTWAFKDYAQQPGLINLLKGEDTGNTTVSTDQDGRLILVTPSTSTLARAARTTTASEIIWMVTDAVVTSAASVFPPPFGWLIKGGWWFLKRIGGAPVRSGTERFMIYASINDARADVPCISSEQNATAVGIGQLHFQQITPGNVGIGEELLMTTRSIHAPIIPGQATPTSIYVTKSTMLTLGTETEVPSVCAWYYNNGGQNHNNQGVGFVCNGTKVCSFTIHKVEIITDVGPADADMFTYKVPFKIYNNTTANLGNAVASAYDVANESPNLWMSNVLVHVDYARGEVFSAKWDTTTATYPTANYQVQITTQKRTSNSNLHINVQPGWYIVQYAVYGMSEGSYMVGQNIIATRGTGEVQLGPTLSARTASHFGTGLFPAYMTGIALTPFTTDEVIYSTTLRAGDDITVSDLDPSFGCDDAYEFPPPPSEEDLADEEDEFEDPEDLEDEEDGELELGPDDDYSDPPMSRLVVHPDAQQIYENLRANFPEREARLAANQLIPSGEYTQFTEMYHNALVDGLSPREARAFALGL